MNLVQLDVQNENERGNNVADFHFVEDYEAHVEDLLRRYPVDTAMEMAVGGAYEQFGTIEFNILRHAGIQSGMSLLDLGCGSGRLASILGNTDFTIDYTGIDIVQSLLDYAVTKSPKHFSFILNRDLTIPVPNQSFDFSCAFSLFTHLLHHETYIYMEEIYRILRPGGKLIFSFIEFDSPHHWDTFKTTIEQSRSKTAPHLNTFIERSVISLWADRLGYHVDSFINGHEAVEGSSPLGQTTAILTRPNPSLL